MALNIKPLTTYYGISFSDGKFLRFFPAQGDLVAPGETIIIENCAYFVSRDDGYETKEQISYTGEDLDKGSWKFSGWSSYRPNYATGTLGTQRPLRSGKGALGLFAARLELDGSSVYYTSLYTFPNDKYGFFIENVSTVDGITTMAQAISEDPERYYVGVINTSKLLSGGFADVVFYSPGGGTSVFGGATYHDDDLIKEIPNSVQKTPGVYEEGGTSGEGGGGGDFDNTSTPIEIPGLPTVSAASTGFISLFNPTLSQLNELASYMWSDIFDIDTLKKLFADPMDVILGLSILPVQIPTSGAREVKVGNIGTGISLNVASTQFVEVDCGTINVNEYWGAYLDYSPYTHAQIYLPYVGVRPISVDEIMGKSVNVKYHVDILTGACCCFVKCGESVLYSFNGQCSIPIPISATNYTNTINGIISVAASLGTMVATGGATAPLAAANLASTITNQMKPTVEKSGAISGPGGVMGIQTPYLILTRPRQALPSEQNTFTGYPSFITTTLGELSGYTEVHSIHLENIPATADELSEIETLLKGGVIF